jgi:hypothetical protein
VRSVSALTDRVAALEKRSPPRFVVPDAGAPTQSLDFFQWLYLCSTVPVQCDAREQLRTRQWTKVELRQVIQDKRAWENLIEALPTENRMALLGAIRAKLDQIAATATSPDHVEHSAA